MSLLGLDIGTTGCKAVVFDEQGKILSSAYREYPLEIPTPGRCELNTEQAWQAIVAVIQNAAREVKDRDPVLALGVSAIGDATTPIDRQGKALGASVVGSPDLRAIPQVEWIAQNIGREKVYQATGVALHTMCVIPKVMWFRQNHPDVYERAWKFAGWQEILQVRLGLEPVLDFSQACRSAGLNIHTLHWDSDLLKACEIDEQKFCRLATSRHIVGEIDVSHARLFGLSPGVRVVAGGFDQACAALGCGVFEADKASLSIGTVEFVTAVSDTLLLENSLLEGNHGCGLHVLSGHYTSLAYIITAGAVLRWYRDTLGLPEKQAAEEQGADPYDYLIAQTPARPARVYVFPYFAGTGTPWLDTRQRGSMFGLALDTERNEIVKGILDSLCYELRLNLESLAASGFDVKKLHASGGGARSARWMQLKADIAGVTIETTQIQEAGCLGAAFLAGLAIGVYDSERDILSLLRFDNVYEPRPAIWSRYEDAFHTYQEIRERLKNLTV